MISTPGAAPRKLLETQEIWQVERISSSENYSNGLHIENKYSTTNHPRSYVAYTYSGSGAGSRAGSADVPTRAETAQAGNSPVGIVYHTTENLAAPFARNQNGPIEGDSGSLLEYVKGKKAYNFVIDRFSRVFRVVHEEDAADHAGYSVWADEKALYVNLNESFLGVAIEVGTAPGQETPTLTEMQIRAIAMLTEMLRARYGIAAANCVTHAQVSVNPDGMLADDHMDWALSFPFAEIGLPDNYVRPLPSIALFGFEWDSAYSRMAEDHLAGGAILGEQQLAKHANDAGVEVDVYRRILRKQYLERLAAAAHTAGTPKGD
jgi:hypothetical protein